MTCACGCGRTTLLAKHTNPKRGTVKGKPVKWCEGHQHRVYNPNGKNWHHPDWFPKRA